MQMQYIQGYIWKFKIFQKICQEHGIKFIELRKWLTEWVIKHLQKPPWLKQVPVVPFSWYSGVIRTSARVSTILSPGAKATAGGGGKGMRVWKMKIYWKHGMELVKNLPLFLGMMECILKTNRRASSYRNSGYWIHTKKHVTFLKEIVLYKGVIKIDWRNSFTIYDRRIASKMGEAVKAAEYIKYEGGNGRVFSW
jgi:hypothetical protein